VILIGVFVLGVPRAASQGIPQRLGEFQVEWYCNARGLGVTILNNQADWACTHPNGQTAFLLTQVDFDAICQATYRDPRAYALRDQGKPQPAYNWSCYVNIIPPTPTPTPIPTRLGTFQVEWYCNERGNGVMLTNNNRDWACTNPQNGQITFVLGQNDFNAICQRTYSNPQAFALKDQQQATEAYNWSCYMPAPPPVPGIVRVGEARPDVFCTPQGYWTGFVNGQEWACLFPGTTNTAVYIRQNEFTALCRTQFNDPRAFATREAFDRVLGGYRWGCYVNNAGLFPTATPFLLPSPTPIPRLTRLGEFQVEWYCNNQGYGVRLANGDRDWVCTNNQTGQVAFTLSQLDFSRICQVTYKDPYALAIQDQQKSTAAYNWSCYTYR